MWTRLALSACLFVLLFAPVAPEAGAGGPSTNSVEEWIAQLSDDDVVTREAATAALAGLGDSAVPALLASVQTGTPRTRSGAAEALRRMGARGILAVPALLSALQTEDDDLGAAAAHALGGIGRGDPSIINMLLDAVRSWRDFEFAAQTLVEMGRTAVPAIIDAITCDNRPFRLRLLHYVLAQMDEEAMDAIPALILLRQGGDVEVAQSAEEVLHGSHPSKEQVIAALITSLESTNWEIRLLCVQQLATHGPDAHMATEGIMKHLREDETAVIRLAAAQAISYIAPSAPAVAEALGDAIGDHDERVVAMAVCALGAIGADNPGAARVLQEHLDRPHPIGAAVEKALAQCGKNGVPFLILALNGSDERVRRRATRVLGQIGPPAVDAAPHLLRALKDESSKLRVAAAAALGKLGAAAVPALVEALAEEDAQMRVYSAVALGGMGQDAADAVPALGKALTDRDAEVRKAAAGALGRIGEPAGPLSKQLAQALRDRDAKVRAAAAVALGDLGKCGKAGAKALAKAMRDRELGVRVAAVEAIGRIGPAAEAATSALLRGLRNAEIEIRWRAARSLGLVRPREKKVVKALTAALTSIDWRVRRHAAVALGSLGSYADEARKALEKLKDDPRTDVREAAKGALLLLDED